jgi:membrane-associated phospholipid phosphatase
MAQVSLTADAPSEMLLRHEATGITMMETGYKRSVGVVFDADARPSIGERGVIVVGVYALFFLGYGVVNRWIPMTGCRDLSTSLDRALPFVPEMILPFVMAYPMLGLPALLLSHKRDLQRAGLAMSGLIVLSLVLFVAFPVWVPRPDHLGDSLSARWVAAIYRSDRPVCGFPSLHGSATVLATLLLWRARVRHAWVYALAAVGVALSTLFVKQHVLADVAGGAGLAWLVHVGATALLPARALAPSIVDQPSEP